MLFRFPSLPVLSMLCVAATVALGEDAKTTSIELAGGKLVMQMPKEWKQEQPKSRIVQYEFSAPADAKEDDAQTARITIMGAGGGVEANLDRWYGQFEQPGGGSTKEKAKLEVFEAGGHKIHFVDVTGSFKDTMGAGPFSGKPAVLRENYRMLGAIIVTEKLGQYFVKITGPDETVAKLTDGFKKMLKKLESK